MKIVNDLSTNEIFLDIEWKFGELQVCFPADETCLFKFCTYLNEERTLWAEAELDQITPEECGCDIENARELIEYVNTRFDEDDIDVWWSDNCCPDPENYSSDENIEELRVHLENVREFIHTSIVQHIKRISL